MTSKLFRTIQRLSIVCLLTSHAIGQEVIKTIPVTPAPFGLAVNSHNQRVYAALGNRNSAAVAVIDASSNALIETVQIPAGAFLVAANRTTDHYYVAGCAFTPLGCSVTVLDGTSNTIVATIPINSIAGLGIEGLAVNPVTNTIYVSDADLMTVDVIDGNSNAITATIPMANRIPLGIDVDALRNRVYVAIDGPYLLVLDGNTNATVRRVNVGGENANVAINPLTQRAYITNEMFSPSTLGVVDTILFQVLANVPVGNTPFDVTVDRKSNLVFVTNINGPTIAAVNGTTNQVISTLSVFGRFIRVNPVTAQVYASDDAASVIRVLSEQ